MVSTSIAPQAIYDALAGMTGSAHVRALGAAIAVAPGNTEELADVLRFANAHGCVMAPWGGGTKQGWGNPFTPTVVLEMGRLNVLREHTWQDMTCTVEAGCTWSALQAGLAQHGQFVALDPLWPEVATVGGVVATNDSGALRLRYGGLRDLIIGMTIVLADGTLAKTGGKVVKNVAGYDLHKLMIGAFGTLGVIASVNFRLHSIPRCERSFTVSTASAEPLGRLMLQLLQSQLSTVAVQLRGGAQGFALDVRLASLAEVLEAQAEVVAGLAQPLAVQAATHDVWGARQSMMAWEVVCKGTMLPSEIARFAERVRVMGGESVTQANGIMLAGFGGGAAEQVMPLRNELEAAGGSLMVLRQPEQRKLPCWGAPPDSLPLMREIKKRFDSEGILNPGRFLGGI